MFNLVKMVRPPYNNYMLNNIRNALEEIGSRDLIEARLHLEALDCDPEKGTAVFAFNPERWMRNEYGGVQGGIIACVMDLAMALPLGWASDAMMGTIEMSTQYLLPMFGDQYEVHTENLHVGNRVCQGRCTIIDVKTGKKVAASHASYSKVNMTPDQLLK